MTWQSDPSTGWNPPTAPAQPGPIGGPASPPAYDPYAPDPQSAQLPAYGQQPYPQQPYPQPYPQQYGQQPYAQQPYPQQYGQQPYPSVQQQWGGPPPIQHRGASKALLGVSIFMLAIALLAALVSSVSDDLYDAPYERVGVLVTSVLLAVLSGTTLALTIAGRRRADRGSGGLLMAAGILAIVLGGLGMLGAVASLATGAGAGGLLGALLYLWAGIRVVRAVRR